MGRDRVLPALLVAAACSSGYGVDEVAADDAGAGDGGALETGPGDAGLDDASSVYRAAVMADAPILYLRLGETSGTAASNEVQGGVAGGVHVGAMMPGAQGALANDPDRALTLAGGHLDVFDARLAFVNRAAYSLEGWVKPTNLAPSSRKYLFSRQVVGAQSEGYQLFLEPGRVVATRQRFGSYDSVSVDVGLPAGRFTHLVVTYDGNEMRLYVDGALATSTPSMRQVVALDASLLLGDEPGFPNGDLRGSIDELAVYDRVLAVERILAHYKIGSGLP